MGPKQLPAGAKKANKPRKRVRKDRASLPFHLVVPTSTRANLVYMDALALTEGAVGAGTAKMMRLNAPYDVDPSLASSAVPGFSEMAGFYQSYRVLRVEVKASFAVFGNAAGSVAQISLFPTATSSVPSSPHAWGVQRRGVTSTVFTGVTTTGVRVPELTLRLSVPAFLGLTKEQWRTDHQYTASTNTIPSKLVFVAVCLRSDGTPTSVPAAATVSFRLAMDIQFFDPVVLSN